MDLQLTQSLDYLINNNINKAEKEFERLSHYDQLKFDSTAGLSICKSLKKELSLAKNFLQMIPKDATSTLISVAKAMVCVLENKKSQAESELKEAFKWGANTFYLNYVTGVFYIQQGDTPEGINYLLTALEIDHKKAVAYSILAGTYLSIKEYYNAVRYGYLGFKLAPSLYSFSTLMYLIVKAYPIPYWLLFGITFLIWVTSPTALVSTLPISIFVVFFGVISFFASNEIKRLYIVFFYIFLWVVYYLTYIK